MLHKYLLTITGVALILLSSCVKEDFSTCATEITITYNLSEFTPADGFSLRAAQTRATPTAEQEKEIQNLYLFLFSSDPNQVKRFYLQDPIGSGVGFEGQSGNIKLYLSPTETGVRDVYLVANCADLVSQLNTVKTAVELQAVLRPNTATALWETTTPLLMSGKSLAHDFTTTPTLNNVTLTRAVAKLQIDVTLENAAHQSATLADYAYQFKNFGAKTHVLENEGDQPNSVSQTEWSAFDAANTAIWDIVTDGVTNKVQSFKLTTYINEYNSGPNASIQFKLPYNPVMPPPYFMDEVYTIQLPSVVERNTLYHYKAVLH